MCGNLESIFLNTLEANALTNSMIFRAGDEPHLNLDPRKAMMQRTTLKKVENNRKIEEDVRKCYELRKLDVDLDIQANRQHCVLIQIDNGRKLWKIMIINTDYLDFDPLLKGLQEQMVVKQMFLIELNK